ncbi:sigma-70 family RNA polymerase sigma factor [Saccharopolyspora rhizosphaerae]|uniref:RNA polymerase sigma factor n=1 Tax=Saccharopolyspora rhizosphaerae TaxID=2492662 RepID=A0A426JXP6_9PSEU|nr:sigma-70 family RNA polymerase sigma factor [Saccharopolyspora rhizosphaerae]RRO18000.1 sigma-70 family RNA polymerase sigma factor [Saccharopolyspora rhizosphaerae]
MSRSEDAHARLTDLALHARRGDPHAMETFIRESQHDVWRFVAHLAGPHLADDLAQETFLRAFRSVRRFTARSSARTWLLSIARRVVVDQIRYERSRPRTTYVSADLDTTSSDTGFEDVVALNLLLRDLDPERREALVLTQVLGLPYADAAHIAGCPVGTIRSRVARAREQLLTTQPRSDEETG